MDMTVTKDREVLTYAVAGRGRMWLTGNTTIHGNLFSTWNRSRDLAVQHDQRLERPGHDQHGPHAGSQIQNDTYQLETLNADDEPIDSQRQSPGRQLRATATTARTTRFRAITKGSTTANPTTTCPA